MNKTSFIFFFLIHSIVFAQFKVIDSLEKILHNKLTPEKEKIIPLSRLAIIYADRDTNKSLNYSKRAVAFARKQKDPKYGIYAYSGLLSTFAEKENFNEINKLIDSCSWYVNAVNDENDKAYGLYQIANNKLLLEDRQGALNSFLESLILGEKTQNKDIIISNYYSLSKYYLFLSDNKKGEKYARLAIAASKKYNNQEYLFKAYQALGFYYQNEYDKGEKKNLHLLDSADYMYRKTLNIYKQYPGVISEIHYINSLLNLCTNYYFIGDKKYTDSITHYSSQILKESEKINFTKYIISSYGLMATAEKMKGNYSKSEMLLLKADSLVSGYKKHLRLRMTIKSDLAHLYKEMNKMDKAFMYLQEFLNLYAESYEEKIIKNSQKEEIKYQTEKKEQEIKFRKKQNYLYIGIVIILGLGLIFLYFSFTYRIRYLKKKKEEAKLLAKIKEEEAKVLEVEKHNAELTAKIKEEEANKLQKEVLVQHMQVEHKNKILENLQENINLEQDVKDLKKLIKNESHLDKNFDDFKKILNDIHPDFYSKLQNKAKQKLTALDLKNCVYIYMKMPAKEMADLLNVELKTIHMNRYRLKQKFGLKKEDDLEIFIQSCIHKS